MLSTKGVQINVVGYVMVEDAINQSVARKTIEIT